MVNKNYVAGRRKEYRVCNKLKEEGCWDIVVRSAGSHSLVDVWAVSKEKKQILLIQVKSNITEREREKIMKEWEWLVGGANNQPKKFEVKFVLEE